ncbi:SRPBCC family protein [uncultured Serinicoccus sp.]|uniref:SRPBCC family protein n=1 Tax=uncultured Serinicoccus sp. TaxID=735514 RepID=UPI002607C619|nr:SRPBCC family protein [uncultured Serinicoccus sp.]
MRRSEVWTSARGPLPVDEAWDRYADPSRWADWAPHLRRVEVDGVSAGGSTRLHAGMSGRVHGTLGLAVDFVVSAVDEPARTWSWTVRLVRPVPGPFRLDLHHTLVALPDSTGPLTEAGLVLSGPAPVVLAYRPVARWALRRLVS